MTKISIINKALSNCSLSEIKQAMLDAGALVIRDANNTVDDFLALGASLGKNFVTQSDEGQYRTTGASRGRNLLTSDRDMFSITANGHFHGLPLHGEFYFQDTEPPQLFWFYCQKPSLTGGHTNVCDGQQLFASLPPDVQGIFLNRSLVYTRFHTPSTWRELYRVETPEELDAFLTQQNKMVMWEADQSVWVHFEAPAVRLRDGVPVFINSFLPFALRQIHTPDQTRARVTFADGYPLGPELVEQVRSCAESLTRFVEWEQGDIALLDNTRMMHGRRELLPEEQRKVFIRLSDADFLSTLRESYEQALKRIRALV